MTHDYSHIKSSKSYRMDATSAGQIAMKLDKADRTTDEKIEASIWNKFANVHNLQTINADEKMDIKKAWNLITKALVKASNGVSTECERLANEWLQAAPEPDGEVTDVPAETTEEGSEATQNKGVSQDANAAGGASAAESTGGTANAQGAANKKTQAKKDAESVKVTVPKYMSDRAKKIIANQNAGHNLRKSLANGDTKGLTKENTAYALGNVNFGPNTQKQAQAVFYNLIARMSDLGIFENGKDYGNWDLVKKLDYKQRTFLLRKYAKRIREADAQIINKDKYRKMNYGKIQKTFDDANKLLAEVANMKPKPKIETENDDGTVWKTVSLKDGRWIQVAYDSKGEIKEIQISHDTAIDSGSGRDGSEVLYTKNKANYDIEHGDRYSGSITSGYDFEKLKALAKRIFN